MNQTEGRFAVGDRSTANGNYVRINYSDGTQGVYLHMETVDVAAGNEVYSGDYLGTSNDTGSSSGPHLRYEQYNDKNRNSTSDPTLAHPDCE